ncbi:uncharacterized protein LOC144173162 isoform X3 [Haemaphysalis longicornis]
MFVSAGKIGDGAHVPQSRPRDLASTPRAEHGTAGFPSLTLKPDIEESHEWKDSHEWKPNPYVRRRPKQGILFLPKPTTSPAPSYFTPKIAGGKRCADDFDCMHVLGQVCKRRRRGNTGNCECPDSTPVKLEDEAQPRCVAGAPR